ncbi:MAG: LysR family transcriptional regulator [Marinibacterium sp.]
MADFEQITLRQLKALKMVAEHRTIVGAAESLHLTGPAVHNQLKKLEEIVGFEVLRREDKGRNNVTPRGAVLVRAYDEIRATLDRSTGEIAALGSGYLGSVTLGIVSTAKYFAPGIVARLSKEMPEVAVNVRIGNRRNIVAGMGRGEYDLCIMGRPPRDPLVEAQAIGDHPYVIIAAPDHPLAGRRGIKPEQLVDEVFVMREPGSGSRILAERVLAELQHNHHIEMLEMESNETIKQSVLHGLGVAVISAHTVAYELEAGRLVSLNVDGTPIRRVWYVVRPTNVVETPIAAKVRDWLVAHAAESLPEVHL